MSYVVEYEPEAFSDLEKLTQAVRERIVSKINWLAENFDSTHELTVATKCKYLVCR